jgi:hypothetical protein
MSSTYYGFPGFIDAGGDFAPCFVGYQLNKFKTEFVLSNPAYAVALTAHEPSSPTSSSEEEFDNDVAGIEFSVAESMDLFPKMCIQRRMENRPVTIYLGPGLVRTAGTLNMWLKRVDASFGSFAKLLEALPTFSFVKGKDGEVGSFTMTRGFDEAKFEEVDAAVPFSIFPRNAMSSTTFFRPDTFPLVPFERAHVHMPELTEDEKRVMAEQSASARTKRRRTAE